MKVAQKMEKMDAFELDNKYVAHSYGRFPLEIVGGKGAVLYGADGREYIDMTSGIAVNTFGASDDEWIEAVTAQAKTIQHISNLFYAKPYGELAKVLCERTGMSKVFFNNSGAEANECAIKAARAYGAEHKGEDYYTILVLKNSFHGRTLTTLAATGQDYFHEKFNPLTPGFVTVPANDVFALRAAVARNKVCGIWMECIQGEGGVNVLDDAFVQEAAKICAEQDIIFMIDEVQTGNGRTGKLYSWMHYGVKPDVFTTAKGLAGGLPIGACVMGEKLADIFHPGENGSTFGGNPMACAGALNILSRIDDALLAEVTRKGQKIIDALSGAPGIEFVAGMGLLLGVKPVKPAADVIAACREAGVLVLSAKDKVRLLPPLNITDAELDKAIEVIKGACA